MTISDLRVLVDNLDEYIHIPGGIERLKKTVLHIAVSGQLVPQIPNEGTGKDLYAEIQANKANISKKTKDLPEVTADEELYAIPSSWEWARLSAITNLITDGTHHTPQYKPSGIPFLSIKDVSAGSMNFSDCKYISQQEHEEINKRCNPEVGDILFCRIGTLGRPVVVNTSEPFSIFVSLGLIKFNQELLLPEYLRVYLDAPATYKEYRRVMAGGSHTNKLNLITMNNLVTALPPVTEQQRILDRLNEILGFIDELDAKYKAEEAERSKFVKSSLRSLSRMGSLLALDNLTSTIQTKSDVAELRKTILHLAVSGKLVTQIASEGTGEELYKKIQSEKAKLVANGKIKKQKPLPEIASIEIPFEIPPSWVWARLIDVSKSLSAGGDKPKDFTKEKTELNTVPVIANGETNEGIIGFTKTAKVFDTSVTVSGRGTIGYSVVRGYPYTPIVRLLVIVPAVGIDPQFIQFVFSSLFEAGMGTSIPQLTVPMISPKPIPLPPLAVQKRIVAKTTELLNLVAELEKHLEK